MAAGDQADLLDYLRHRNMPVVMIDRDLPNVEVDAVLTDHQLGGFLATRHLLDLGHTRIACIADPPASPRVPNGSPVTEEHWKKRDSPVTKA